MKKTTQEEKTVNGMIRKRTKVLAVLAGALLAFLAVHQQTRAQSIDVEPPDPDRVFSPMAFAFGQTARVNIAQIGDPTIFPAGAACGIIVNYFAADGTSLAPPFRGQVEPGKIVFVDLDRNSLPIRTNRVPFRVAVRLVGDPNLVPDPCSQIRASVEVYDNFTGRTMVFIGDPHSGVL
jgi:hypothetical protein